MHNSPHSVRPSSFRVARAALVAAALGALSTSVFAQTNGATDGRKRGGDNGGSPQDMQARMLTALRERFEVTDDEEWKLVSDRLNKVLELRRNSASTTFGGGMLFGRGGPQGGGGGDTGRGNRTSSRGGSSNTEMTALGMAIRDKLPDAEIKSRLDRVREMRKENDMKLAKAQEELRAVLSVRQEALAVMAGLLP